jgi:hypothetical protein
MNEKQAQRLVIALEMVSRRCWWIAFWLFVLLFK